MTRGLQSGLLLNLTDERDHFYTKAKQREKKKKKIVQDLNYDLTFYCKKMRSVFKVLRR